MHSTRKSWTLNCQWAQNQPKSQILYKIISPSNLHSGVQCLVWVQKCSHVWLDQNFDPSLLTNKLWLVFMGKKQKFLSLCRTTSLPYRLSYINALRINQFYKPKDQLMKVSQKIIENWRFWKTLFFWVGHFESLFSKKSIFLLFSHENKSNFIG